MKVFHIAQNTFKECVRDKILYNLVIFAVLIIVSSLILGTITIGDVKQIIVNLGLSTLSLFGTLIAIFIGIQLVYKEIDKKTIYSLLSKPVARYEFILGKYFGLTLTLLVNVSVMLLGIYASILYLRRSFELSDFYVLLAGLLILVQLMLVTAIALFFSTFSSPALSALFTFSVYVIGHFNSDIRQYGLSSDSVFVKILSSGLYFLVPNFGNFNIISDTAHGRFLGGHLYALSLSYGAVYSGCMILLAILVFQRRNFK
ncbi:MAG: ABC transporter permease [Acidobacteria bacterium]|nr:ABC transporter permease [Acidobacteriota bacterium]